MDTQPKVTEEKMRKPIFGSLVGAGWECSLHGGRNELRATGHLQCGRQDYELLAKHGILWARDGIIWRDIEPQPNEIDFSGLEGRVEAAVNNNVTVVWDLTHYDYPFWINGEEEFNDFFEKAVIRLTKALVAYLKEKGVKEVWLCPFNESLFWISTVDDGYMKPGRDSERWRQQLIRLTSACVKAAREIDPNVRFMHAEQGIEPVIDFWKELRDYDPRALDVLAINFYPHTLGDEKDGAAATPGYLSGLIQRLRDEFGRPVIISETSGHGKDGPSSRLEWMEVTKREIAAAGGVEAVCYYPITDNHDWDSRELSRRGLYSLSDDNCHRKVDKELLRFIQEMNKNAQ